MKYSWYLEHTHTNIYGCRISESKSCSFQYHNQHFHQDNELIVHVCVDRGHLKTALQCQEVKILGKSSREERMSIINLSAPMETGAERLTKTDTESVRGGEIFSKLRN